MSNLNAMRGYQENAATLVAEYVNKSVGDMIAMRDRLMAEGREKEAKRISNRVMISKMDGLPANLIVNLTMEEEWPWDSIPEDRR